MKYGNGADAIRFATPQINIRGVEESKMHSYLHAAKSVSLLHLCIFAVAFLQTGCKEIPNDFSSIVSLNSAVVDESGVMHVLGTIVGTPSNQSCFEPERIAVRLEEGRTGLNILPMYEMASDKTTFDVVNFPERGSYFVGFKIAPWGESNLEKDDGSVVRKLRSFDDINMRLVVYFFDCTEGSSDRAIQRERATREVSNLLKVSGSVEKFFVVFQ